MEYPKIGSTLKDLGAPGTGRYPDGTAYYSLPVIHDAETGEFIADSWNIVLYLDAHFPSTVCLIRKGNIALTKSFVDRFEEKIVPTWVPWNVLQTCNSLLPDEQEYYRKTREAYFGKKLEALVPDDDQERKAKWDEVKKGFDHIEELLKLNDSDEGVLVGDTISYADLFVLSWILWWKVHGEESLVWKEIETMNEGRWGKMILSRQAIISR